MIALKKSIIKPFLLLALIMVLVLSGCKTHETGDASDIEEPYGLVNVSVCNMRPLPAHNTELISQAVMGTPVKILKLQSGWCYIQTPESYEGWVPSQAIQALKLSGFEEWLNETMPTEEHLLECALSFKGIPYLWGGTSSKAFDCSGFVKTVYYMNGLIFLRDASQQFIYGIKISKEGYPDSLRVGDLMFFGYEKDGKERATHVGMYIDNTEFIHASGMVKINSLDSTRSNFSRGRRGSFLGARRIIGAEGEQGLQAVSKHPWYN